MSVGLEKVVQLVPSYFLTPIHACATNKLFVGSKQILPTTPGDETLVQVPEVVLLFELELVVAGALLFLQEEMLIAIAKNSAKSVISFFMAFMF